MGTPFVCETTFRVRYAETDAMGIVHHAQYLVYFEEGRSELSRQAGASYAKLEESGVALAVTEAELRYLAPARYDEKITVKTQVERVRSRSVTFAYQVVRTATGEQLVTGRTTLISINREGQITRLPEFWVKTMSKLAGQA